MNNDFNLDKFKNLIEYKSGYTWSKDQELNSPENGSIRVLTVTNIQKELDLSSKLYLKNVSENDKERKAVSKDWTIAVSSNGNRKRIGNAVYIYENTEYLFASFLTGFKPKENSGILPNYFSYWMKSHPVQERITSISEGTTGLGNLDIRYLRNMEIEYPDRSEQRAIASVLSKVDDAITATKNTIAKAERLKKALMQNLLTGRLKPDGTRRTDDEFYVDEKFGKVPMGWEVRPIKSNEVCKINPTYEYQNGNGFPFVPMEAMNEQFKGIEYFNSKVVESSSGLTRFKNGDILFAKITPCTENGKATIVESLESDLGFASTEFIVFSPSENIDGLFLFYRMINTDSRNLMVSLMEGTTGRQRIPSNIFKRRVLISYPENKDEQVEIIQPLIKIDSSIKEKEQKIQKLECLKKALMQDLLTGKKRLKAGYIQGFVNG